MNYEFDYSLEFNEISNLTKSIIDSIDNKILLKNINNTIDYHNKYNDKLTIIINNIENMCNKYCKENFLFTRQFIVNNKHIESKICFYLNNNFINMIPKYLINDSSNLTTRINTCSLLFDKYWNLIAIIQSVSKIKISDKYLHEYLGYMLSIETIRSLYNKKYKEDIKKLYWIGDIYIQSATNFLKKFKHNKIKYIKGNSINNNFVYQILINGICDKIAGKKYLYENINMNKNLVPITSYLFENKITYYFQIIKD